MERVFWIEDELRFDERKLPAIFSAITVEQYADVGLVVEELVFVYVLSLVLEKSCKGCSQQWILVLSTCVALVFMGLQIFSHWWLYEFIKPLCTPINSVWTRGRKEQLILYRCAFKFGVGVEVEEERVIIAKEEAVVELQLSFAFLVGGVRWRATIFGHTEHAPKRSIFVIVISLGQLLHSLLHIFHSYGPRLAVVGRSSLHDVAHIWVTEAHCIIFLRPLLCHPALLDLILTLLLTSIRC